MRKGVIWICVPDARLATGYAALQVERMLRAADLFCIAEWACWHALLLAGGFAGVAEDGVRMAVQDDGLLRLCGCISSEKLDAVSLMSGLLEPVCHWLLDVRCLPPFAADSVVGFSGHAALVADAPTRGLHPPHGGQAGHSRCVWCGTPSASPAYPLSWCLRLCWRLPSALRDYRLVAHERIVLSLLVVLDLDCTYNCMEVAA